MQSVACFSRKCALVNARLEVGAPRGWIPPCHCDSLGSCSCILVSPQVLCTWLIVGVILCLSDLLVYSQTSAQRPASLTLYACPAVAVPTVPAIVSPVMGLTGLCVPRMGTHMTMIVGANRLSVDNSRTFPPSTRARVVSSLGSSWE